MKKIVILLFVLLLLPVMALSQSSLRHISDLAGVLTPQQVSSLEEQAQALYEETGFDAIVHTTNNSQRKAPDQYTYDYYDSFRDTRAYPDGAMFSVMFDTRDWFLAINDTMGKSQYDWDRFDRGDSIARHLSNGDYYDAFSTYISLVRQLVERGPVEPGRVYQPGDYGYTGQTAFQLMSAPQRLVTAAPFALGGGLLIGLVYALILKSKLKIAKFKYGAQQYVDPNSLNLTDSQDIYLYQTVTRRKIETNNSSCRGRGGFSSGRSGGSSFSGRGGKF